MILDTDRDSLVYLHRNGNVWPLGFGSSMSKGEPTKLHVHAPVHEGDQLTFSLEHQVWQDTVVVTVTISDAQSPLLPHCRVNQAAFEAMPACPGCGTREPHEVEIPATAGVAWLYHRYVLRTCAVCDASWEQEADT